MTHLVLSSGDSMPYMSLGCWKIPRKLCEDVVHEAIKIGYRCIDKASNCENEFEWDWESKKQ